MGTKNSCLWCDKDLGDESPVCKECLLSMEPDPLEDGHRYIFYVREGALTTAVMDADGVLVSMTAQLEYEHGDVSARIVTEKLKGEEV